MATVHKDHIFSSKNSIYCIVFLTLSWNTRTRLVLDDARRSRLILISPNDFYIDPVKAMYFLLLPIKLHFLRNLYNMKLINHFQFCRGSLKATGRDIAWRCLWQIGQKTAASPFREGTDKNPSIVKINTGIHPYFKRQFLVLTAWYKCRYFFYPLS